MHMSLILLLILYLAPLPKLYSEKSTHTNDYQGLNTLATPSQTPVIIIHGLEQQTLADLHRSTILELRQAIWHFKNELITESHDIIAKTVSNRTQGLPTDYLSYNDLVAWGVARPSTPKFQERALLAKTGDVVQTDSGIGKSVEFMNNVSGFPGKLIHANSYGKLIVTQCPTRETSYDFLTMLASQPNHQKTSPQNPILIINLTNQRESQIPYSLLVDKPKHSPAAYDYWPAESQPTEYAFSPMDLDLRHSRLPFDDNSDEEEDDDDAGSVFEMDPEEARMSSTPPPLPPKIKVSASLPETKLKDLARLTVQPVTTSLDVSSTPTVGSSPKYTFEETATTDQLPITTTVMLEIENVEGQTNSSTHMKMIRFQDWPDGAIPGVATNPKRDEPSIESPKEPLWSSKHYRNGLNNPSYEIPEHFFELVNIILRHQEQNPEQKICMHCSKGIGRTGVLALILHLEQQIAKALLQGTSIKDLKPNIPQAVRDLRSRRFGSIGIQDNRQDKDGNHIKRYSTQLEFIYFWIQHRQKVHSMLEFLHRSKDQDYLTFKEKLNQLSPHEQESVFILGLIHKDKLMRNAKTFIDSEAKQYFANQA